MNPSELQKAMKYASFCSSVIVSLKSGEFYIIMAGIDSSVLDIDLHLRIKYVAILYGFEGL